jgi:hypothetical protein
MVRNTDDRSDYPSYLYSGSPWSRVRREDICVATYLNGRSGR